MNKRILTLAVMLLVALLPSGSVQAETREHLYSTWDTLELDSCASAWLIKNFVDPEAEFKFYPKGDLIEEGIPFNTPEAKFRRTAHLSTFETILQEYQLQDNGLIRMGEIIHQIEVNVWYGDLDGEGAALNQKIHDIVIQSKPPQEILELSFSIFDEFFTNVKSFASSPAAVPN